MTAVRLRRLKQRLRPRWFKTARELIQSFVKLHILTWRHRLQPMTGNPLARGKKSDTLFVLGSGTSINRFSPGQWAEIAAADSVGLNFWLLHDFVPDAYVFERGRLAHDRECFTRNLAARHEDYRDVRFILKDGERHRRAELDAFLQSIPAAMRRNLMLSWDKELKAPDREGFADFLDDLDRRGALTSPRYPAWRTSASIFFVTLLALRAGYRKVVLCGVDLTGSDYFFDEIRDALTAKGRDVPRPRPAANVHKTDDVRFAEIPISHALSVLAERVLPRHGMQLYVGSTLSKLHPMLPCYFASKETSGD